MNRKVLVVGGNGGIAKTLTSSEQVTHFEISTISRNFSSTNQFHQKQFQCDLSRYSDVRKIFALTQPNHVIYLAHQKRLAEESSNSYIETNINMLRNTLDSIDDHSETKFIFASSSAVYGTNYEMPIPETATLNPNNYYGELKAFSEDLINQYCVESEQNHASLRIFNVYGPNMSSSLINQISDSDTRHSLTLLGPSEFIRDYIDVRDVSIAMYKAMDAKDLPKSINVGTGVPVSNDDLLTYSKDYFNFKLNIKSTFWSYSVADTALATEKLKFSATRTVNEFFKLAKS